MKALLNYTVVFVIALIIGWAFMEVREALKYKDENRLMTADAEWCLIDILDSAGGQIIRTTAGSDVYRVIGTQRGFEVYQKCSK